MSGIGVAIWWPLAHGSARLTATVLCVCLFTAASTLSLLAHCGWKPTAAIALIVLVFAWLVEFIGSHTGFPFGSYSYTAELGFAIGGVPILVPLAWLMIVLPALVLGRIISTNRVWVALAGGAAMAAWDIFLDPQMVAEHYWVWKAPGMTLPGINDIPVTNIVGWIVMGTLLIAIIDAVPRDTSVIQRVPLVVWAWALIGGVIGNFFYFGTWQVALWGALAMGAITILALLSWSHTRPSALP